MYLRITPALVRRELRAVARGKAPKKLDIEMLADHAARLLGDFEPDSLPANTRAAHARKLMALSDARPSYPKGDA